MLTIDEKQLVKMLAKLLKDEQDQNQMKEKMEFQERSRDEMGRFLPANELLESQEESEYESDERRIKLVKVKGSYNSYIVKECLFTLKEKMIMFTIAAGVLYAVFS